MATTMGVAQVVYGLMGAIHIGGATSWMAEVLAVLQEAVNRADGRSARASP